VSRRLFALAVVVLLLVGLAQSIAHVWETIHRSTLDSLVDLERNNGIPDVLSTLVIVVGCAGAVAVSRATRTSRDRWAAALLACTLALVALDDLVQASVGLSTARGLAVVAVVTVATALLVAVAARAGTRARWTIVLGLVALALSLAVGQAPDFASDLERARGERVAELEIAIKQGLELAGWWFIALGLWDLGLGLRTARRRERTLDRQLLDHRLHRNDVPLELQLRVGQSRGHSHEL
jgi:hypothetical protein